MIETDSHECATIICLYNHSEKLKPIDHVLLKFAVVIIVLSIKTQLLCDVLIGQEPNEITPTAISDDWTFYDKPWGIELAAIF